MVALAARGEFVAERVCQGAGDERRTTVAMAPQHSEHRVLERLARQPGLSAQHLLDRISLVVLGQRAVAQHGQAHFIDRVRDHLQVLTEEWRGTAADVDPRSRRSFASPTFDELS